MKEMTADIQDQVQLVNGLRLAEQQPRIVRTQEINRLRRRLNVLEQLETFVESDEAQRETQKTAADDRLKELQAKQKQAMKPAQEKLREIGRKYAKEHRELAEAMAPYFAEVGPEPFGELKRQRVSGQFQECSVQVQYGIDEKRTLQIFTSYQTGSRMRGFANRTVGRRKSRCWRRRISSSPFTPAVSGSTRVRLVMDGSRNGSNKPSWRW